MANNKIDIQSYFHVKLLKEKFLQTVLPLLKDVTQFEMIFNDFVKRYSGPGRHYHNLHHIDGMTGLLEYNADKILDYESVFLAIIYHDIIYNVKRSDNEEKSAEYFRDKIGPLLNLSKNRINKVWLYILATKHQLTAKQLSRTNSDIKYLLDFDLETLGTRHKSTYEWYREGVRKEYRIYSDADYNKGRKAFIENFLKKKNIYFTEDFKKIEKIARKNLRNEIKLYLC